MERFTFNSGAGEPSKSGEGTASEKKGTVKKIIAGALAAGIVAQAGDTLAQSHERTRHDSGTENAHRQPVKENYSEKERRRLEQQGLRIEEPQSTTSATDRPLEYYYSKQEIEACRSIWKQYMEDRARAQNRDPRMERSLRRQLERVAQQKADFSINELANSPETGGDGDARVDSGEKLFAYVMMFDTAPEEAQETELYRVLAERLQRIEDDPAYEFPTTYREQKGSGVKQSTDSRRFPSREEGVERDTRGEERAKPERQPANRKMNIGGGVDDDAPDPRGPSGQVTPKSSL